MGSEWEEKSFGELFSVKHGFAFKGEHFADEPTRHLLTTPGNFAIGGGFQNPKPKFYDGPVPEDYVLNPGDVVVTMTDLSKASDTLGNAALIPEDENVWLHNQRVGLLEFHDLEAVDPQFICYLLRANEYRSWIVGSATGTTVKHTSPSRIEEFSCPIPPLPEQKAISHILGTLDDKIELNRRMNATLEGMAQALFKSWFVDFDPVIDNALAAGNPIPDELAPRAEVRKKALAERNQCSSERERADGVARSRSHLRFPPEDSREPVPQDSSTNQQGTFDEPPLLDRNAETNLQGDKLARQRSEDSREPAPQDSPSNVQGTFDEPTLFDRKSLFPAAFQFTEELGWIPEGWGATAISDAISVNPSTKLKKGDLAPFADMKALPTSGYAIDGVIEKAYSGGAKFQNGDVLLARITPCLENGKTGVVDFLTDNDPVGFGSTEFIVLRGDGDLSTAFIACVARDSDFRKHCEQSMIGSSGRQRVHNSCFDSYYLALPKNRGVVSKFDALAVSAFAKATRQSNENKTLTKLRDTLLPKLISGELRST